MAKGKMIDRRKKGHSFERYIAALFRSIGYTNAHRQLEFQINNALGIDLADTGRYKIQCKKLKQYVSMRTIEEVKGKGDDVAVLISAGDNQPPLVTMYLADWLELVANNIDDLNTKPLARGEGLKVINKVKTGEGDK